MNDASYKNLEKKQNFKIPLFSKKIYTKLESAHICSKSVSTCVIFFSHGSSVVEQSTANFCLQVAAWVSDMFCNFYEAKNHKIANNLTNTKARKK